MDFDPAAFVNVPDPLVYLVTFTLPPPAPPPGTAHVPSPARNLLLSSAASSAMTPGLAAAAAGTCALRFSGLPESPWKVTFFAPAGAAGTLLLQ